MMKLNVKILCLIISISVGSIREAHAQVDPFKRTVDFVLQLLKDPMLPQGVRDARLEAVKAPDKNDVQRQYKIEGQSLPPDSYNVCTLFLRPTGAVDFALFLSNNDVNEVTDPPHWEKIKPQWDLFVDRHWKGAKIQEDWQAQINSIQSNRGLFSVQYTIKENEVKTLRLTLKIRLADGKIGEINTNDRRLLFQNKTIPPALNPLVILEAAKAAIKTSKEEFRSATDIKIIQIDRDAGVTKDQVLPFDVVYLSASNPEGKKFIVQVHFNEITRQATIAASRPDDSQAPNRTGRTKASSSVVDGNPSWASNGDLFFTTTRDVKGRPWWDRIAYRHLTSVAVFQAEKREISIIRPLKIIGKDTIDYTFASLSPDGERIAVRWGNKSSLGIIDLAIGQFSLPQGELLQPQPLIEGWKNPKILSSMHFDWEVNNFCWVKGAGDLIISTHAAYPDLDLFVAREDKATKQWVVKRLLNARGNDSFPALSSDQSKIAWFHSVSGKRNIPGKDETSSTSNADRFEFRVAKINLSESKIENIKVHKLNSPILSISWNELSQSWLIVTGEGISSIEEVNGKLEATQLPALSWNGIRLTPSFAAVSYDGKRVAVAAKLGNPQTYEDSEVVAYSLIFLWDGSSPEVTPLFNPTLNQVERFVFPKTNSPWVMVCGDLRRDDLSSLIDPSYVCKK